MKKLKGKKLWIAIILLIVIIVIAVVAYASQSDSTSDHDSDTETTSEATTSEESTDDDDSDDSQQTNGAIEETDDEEEFATDSTTAAERESEESDELFRICLAFIEEYELDSDDFQVEKALMVQDLSNDYIYFQCTHGDTKEYACYTYDGYYFRDDVSQKTLKEEYEDTLVTMKNDEDEYNVYYQYSDEDIELVNDMF